MAETHRFSVSVAAAVVREDGRMLAIQRRDNGHWEPPGGVLEPGETILDGLVREVREETGYVIEAGELTGVYQNMKRDIVALVFPCSVAGGTMTLTDEARSVRWLTAEEVGEAMSEAYAVRVLDAFENRTEPTVRSHDGRHLR